VREAGVNTKNSYVNGPNRGGISPPKASYHSQHRIGIAKDPWNKTQIPPSAMAICIYIIYIDVTRENG
jgi:hypothetical protein